MRLEIQIGSKDPIYIPIKSVKVLLGSAQASDVVISHPAISRKHLVLTKEGDKIFVTDQGSTNGTYINEERLVPGRKTEFTSFFPMRLGQEVLVSLNLEQDPGSPREILVSGSAAPQEDKSTRVVSLKEFKKGKENVIKHVERKQIDMKKKAVEKPKPKKKISITTIMAISIVLVGAYYNFTMMRPSEPEQIARVGEFIKSETASSETPVTEVVEPELIPDQELTKKESFATLRNDLKCVTDSEAYVCDSVGGARDTGWGAVQVGTMINVFVDSTNEYQSMKKEIKYESDGSADYDQRYANLVNKATALKFLIYRVPKDFDYGKVKDLKLTFALHDNDSGETQLLVTFAVRPEKLQELKSFASESMLTSMKVLNSEAEAKLNSYIKFY